MTGARSQWMRLANIRACRVKAACVGMGVVICGMSSVAGDMAGDEITTKVVLEFETGKSSTAVHGRI